MVRLAALVLLLLSACTPTSDEHSGSFVDVPDDSDAEEQDLDEQDLDEQDPADSEDPDQDDTSDDDDAVDPEAPEDLVELDWDVSPPEVSEGAFLVMRINCGMMPTRSDTVWRWDGTNWLADPTDPREILGEDYDEASGSPFEDLEPCWVPNPQPVLTWDDDGRIHFDNATWDHDLRPTEQEDT